MQERYFKDLNCKQCVNAAELGFDLFQGYYFARPGFEHLPEVDPNLFEV